MLKALGKRVLVSLIEVQKKEKPVLILTLPKDEQFYTALVRGVGSEVDSNLEPGDQVYILQDSGIPVEINGERFISVLETHILAAWRE